MNKKIKKTIWYSTSLLVLGGISAAIAVPIVLSNNKSDTWIPDIVPGDHLTEDLTYQEIKDALDEAGINDEELLNKTNYATASYLYTKEQEGSIAYQKLNFYYDQYSKILEIRDYMINTLKLETVTGHNNPDDFMEKDNFIKTFLVNGDNWNEAKTDKYQEVFDLLMSDINNFINNEDDKDKKDSYRSQYETYKEQWKTITDKIVAIDNNKIPYGEEGFSTKYPTILLTEEKIKSNQTDRYNDQKESFIKNYATRPEGESQWEKERMEQYNGATSDAEAIDYLVYQEIQKDAFTRYDFSINDQFTISKIKSMIFKDIVGDKFDESATMVSIDEKAKEDDNKAYFMSSGTKVISEINISANKSYETIEDIINARNLVHLQNVVLDIKQGTETYLDNWTVSKDLMANWFSTYNTDEGIVPVYQNVKNLFHIENEAAGYSEAEEDRDYDLIAYHTSTKDGTQFKSGDLGYKTALDIVGQMVEPFSLGITSALDKIYNGDKGILQNDPDYQPIVEDYTFLERLVNEIEIGMANLLYENKSSGFVDPNSWNKANEAQDNVYLDETKNHAVFAKNFFQNSVKNNALIEFINKSVTDEEITIKIGSRIKNVFNDITNQDGKDSSGIAQIIKIYENQEVYLLVTPDFGIHIVKIETEISEISTAIEEELKIVAKDQDVSSQKSDFSSILKDNYDRQNQVNDLLKNKDYQDFLNENIEDYEPTTEEGTIAGDVQKMITSLMIATTQNRIQEADPQKFIDYLIEKFDNDMVSTSFAPNPRKIYSAIQELATTAKGDN